MLDAGIVIQDPERADRVVFNVPIFIPKVAVDQGGFEAFAAAYGWTPTVLDADQVEIVNPQPAYDKAVDVIWNFVRDVFKAQMLKQAEIQAREQAITQIDQILA